MERIFISILIILLNTLCVSAQKEANIWYFGQNAGLDFNNDTVVPLTDGQITSDAAGSTISDQNGNLLFYTDGVTVWDANHDTMPNGTGLLGDNPGAQPAIIIPQPGNDSLLYIFTATNRLRYSIVNLNLNGGAGDIVAGAKNISLLDPATARLTATRHKNGCDVWLITHEWNTDSFYVYLISNTGISSPMILEVGMQHQGNIGNSTGQIKISPNGEKVALVIAADRLIEVLDFDNTTGVLSNSASFTTPNFPFGLSFSPNSSMLYVSSRLMGDSLIQFNLLAGDSAAIQASVNSLPSMNNLGVVQLAPDGNIYKGRKNVDSLGVIINPDNYGLASNYINNGIYLGGKINQGGLPHFIESYFNSTRSDFSFTYDSVCTDYPLIFIANSSYTASWSWNFDDTTSANNTDTSQNPIHTFSDTGVYNVQLIITGACRTDTVVKTIVVEPNTMSVDLGSDTTTCYGIPLVLNGQNPGSNYIWSTGDTTQTITTDTAGTYYVLVSQKGCFVSDTITISQIPEIIVNLGNDTINCAQDSILLDAGTTGNIFIWSTGDTTQTISVDSTSTYSVSVFNSGCFNSDTIGIVQSQVSALILNTDTTLNLGSSIPLSGIVTGGSNYAWSPATGLSCTSCLNPLASPEETTTYTLTVTDTNNCEASDDITINVDASGVIFIPDIFSPNNDGSNDVLYVRGKGIAAIHLVVYDRWGEMVFETTDITVGWDGTYQGKPMNPAVFVYYVTGSFTNGNEINEKGHVALVR